MRLLTCFLSNLFLSQLFHDGHQEVALSLASSVGRSANPPAPSDQLFRFFARALQLHEAEQLVDFEQASKQNDEEDEVKSEQEDEASGFLKYPLQFTHTLEIRLTHFLLMKT